MLEKKKTWLIVAVIAVILVIVIILSRGKKEPTGVEEGLPEVKVEDLPAAPEVEVKTEEPVAIVEGASPVTSEGVVLTDEGTATNPEGVGPGSVEAPKQSKILEEEEVAQVAENAISLEVSREGGFVPAQFKVKPGQAVTILLTAKDDQKHILRFKDRQLKGVAITVKDGESRATTFNAPTQVGIYDFICSDPGHPNETGQMFVTEE
jgi:plastocyanin